jgi:hypothetical protein
VERKFAVALSEKDNETAPKEISLKIKSFFPKKVKFILVVFTPHYKPIEILKTINFTLKPNLLLGIQSPFLIFQERIIEKGIIGICINKKETELKELFIKNENSQDVESSLRIFTRNFPSEKEFILSFLSHNLNPYYYLRGVQLSLGKAFNIIGAGYIKKYSSKNYLIINNTINDGILNILGKGLQIDSLKIEGFIPLGKSFKITKAISKNGIIMEIDNQPAINIYKKYLEEKFDIFIKNRLFTLYPLGMIEDEETRFITVVNCLEDGSLVCIGNIKENAYAHIMFLHLPLLYEALKIKLESIKTEEETLVFIINSILRKRILKEYAEEEIKLITTHLGDRLKIVGIYSDYSIFPYKGIRDIGTEATNLLLTLWK